MASSLNDNHKPIASLSLDLDDKWSYMKTHGDAGWEGLPSYLDILIPRVLEFLAAHDLKITFFIVGQDAALERNRDLLRAIADAGHEIGNHSFHHEPWLHLYSNSEIEREIAMAEESIERATGQKPVGFRGPGFSVTDAVLRELVRRGYLYDASTFPSLLNPLIRAYYFKNSNYSEEEKSKRRQIGGSLSDGMRPIKSYLWNMRSGPIVEIPVTTMPLFRIPIHFSYLLCIGSFSVSLARRYFQLALKLCQLTGIQPSMLLHPTDFLVREDTPELSFFPAMTLEREQKLALISDCIKMLSLNYEIVCTKKHAEAIRAGIGVKLVEPDFETKRNIHLAELGTR